MFSIRLSFNSKEIFFEAPVVGYTLYCVEFNGGETISCLLTSFKDTYSSKVSVNPSLSKKVVLSLGEALINRGGMLSLGPPVGEALLAHCTNSKRSSAERKRRARRVMLFKFPTK